MYTTYSSLIQIPSRCKYHAWRISIASILLTLPAAHVQAQGQTTRHTLIQEDVEREYHLHVPSSYSAEQSWPLVVSLHGRGSDGDRQMDISQMNRVADQEGFLVTYPNAIDGSWSNRPELTLGFVDSMLGSIATSYNVDTSRIYATGASQGAIRTYLLAVERPDVFAAIAPVGGVRPLLPDGGLYPARLPHVPSRPFPLLHVHGTADNVIPYEGSSTFPSVDRVVSEWAENNRCVSPSAEEPPTSEPQDPNTVTTLEYTNCAVYTGESIAERVADVQLYRVHGGGHSWPATASAAIWEFFSQHELPASNAETPQVLPGDADQDLDFDQLDLVQVQVAAKYLSGAAATWGEGDWNGSSEGSPGNPPIGNGLFDQRDVIAALSAGTYLTGPYKAIHSPGHLGNERASVIYDSNSSELVVAPQLGVEWTSISIESAASIFTGDAAANLGGSFDNDTDTSIFKITFGDSFGNVAQTGLSPQFILDDLSVTGSLARGGDLRDVELVVVPEPNSAMLFAIGLAIGLSASRKLRQRGRQ